jgi:hypothetical protein
VSEYWHNGDAYIYRYGKSYPPSRDIEDSVVDVGQINEKAGEEEEE